MAEDELKERVRQIEITCAARKSTMETVDDHEERIREIEKLTPALRAAMWALTALAGSRPVRSGATGGANYPLR